MDTQIIIKPKTRQQLFHCDLINEYPQTKNCCAFPIRILNTYIQSTEQHLCAAGCKEMFFLQQKALIYQNKGGLL